MPPRDELFAFVHAPGFDDDWAELGLSDVDLVRLQTALLQDPESGVVIEGAGGLRKLRFSRHGSGKSGGCRVCYASYPGYGVILLVMAYGKSRKSELTQAEKKGLVKVMKTYEKHLAANLGEPREGL